MIPFRLFYERALGLIEVVNFKELGPVDAKVDSGNGAFNVLHGTDLQEYGDTVNFKTINNKGITKKIHDFININIGAGKVEKRPVVLFDIEFAGKQWKNIPFSISDRSTNEQPVLIGKDFIVKNGGVIDVTKTYNVGEAINIYIRDKVDAEKKELFFEGRTPVPQDVKDVVEVLYNQGLSTSKISQKMGLGQSTVSNILKKIGLFYPGKNISKPKQIIPQEIKDKIIELSKQGIVPTEIATRLGVPLRYVYQSTGIKNLPQTKLRIPQEIIDKIIELSKQGVGTTRIARLLGISQKTAYNYAPLEHKPIWTRGVGSGRQPIPEKIRDIIVDLSKQGMNSKQIGKQLKLSPPTVLKYIPSTLRKKRGGPSISQEIRDKIIELSKQGMKSTQIGKLLGISQKTAYNYLPSTLKQKLDRSPESTPVKLENRQFFFERSGRPTSQKTIDKIIELRKKKLPLREISKILRVDRNTVRKHLPPELKEINLPRGRIIPQEIKDKIIILRKQKLTTYEIADILKIDPSTVRISLPQELRNIGLKSGGRPKLSQEQINKIIELRRRRLSSGNIGKILGVSAGTIKRYTPPELKNIGLVGGKKISQDIRDKIIELRKKGASVIEIGRMFNLSQSGIRKILPPDLKNIRSWRGSNNSNVQKKSGVVKSAKRLEDIKLTYDPVKSKIVTGRFVKFLRKNTSKTLYDLLKPTIGDYKDDQYGPVEPSKYTKKILDNIHKGNYYDRVDRVLPKLADMPISQFVSKLKSLNIQPTDSEIRWLKINGTGANKKFEMGAKRAHISRKKDLRNFAKSEAGKKIIQDLRDQGKSFDEIKKALRAALSEEKRKARERGEAYIRPEFEQISGKLENRKHEFQAITPYINKMPDTIKVISLPAEYAFEKSLINAFDKNIISYGARLNEFNKIKTISQKVSQETNNRIKPYITSANVNKLIYNPGKGAFYDPTQVVAGKSSISLPADADVIDLDYLGYPGTTVNQSMSLSPDHNPFLYPVLAAKNNLKSGGLLMVTYTLIGVKGQDFTDTRAYKQSDVFDYSLQDYGKFSFKKNNVPSHVKPSLKLDDSEGSQFERYKTAVPIANLYLSGLMNCAKDKGVNIQPVYTNIYRGSGPFVMWRGVFAKQ